MKEVGDRNLSLVLFLHSFPSLLSLGRVNCEEGFLSPPFQRICPVSMFSLNVCIVYRAQHEVI